MLLCRFSVLFFYALMNFCLLHGIDFLLRFLHLLQEFHIFFHNRKMSGGISRCDSSPWPSPRLNNIFSGFFFTPFHDIPQCFRKSEKPRKHKKFPGFVSISIFSFDYLLGNRKWRKYGDAAGICCKCVANRRRLNTIEDASLFKYSYLFLKVLLGILFLLLAIFLCILYKYYQDIPRNNQILYHH